MLGSHCGIQDGPDLLAHHCPPRLDIIMSQLRTAAMVPLTAQLDDVAMCEIVRLGSSMEEVVKIFAYHGRGVFREGQLKWLRRRVKGRV